jgi:hypothetical protein
MTEPPELPAWTISPDECVVWCPLGCKCWHHHLPRVGPRACPSGEYVVATVRLAPDWVRADLLRTTPLGPPPPPPRHRPGTIVAWHSSPDRAASTTIAAPGRYRRRTVVRTVPIAMQKAPAMPAATLSARSIKATIVLDPAAVRDALAPLQAVTERIQLAISVDGRTCFNAIELHGPDNASCILQGKLIQGDVLADAGLSSQPKVRPIAEAAVAAGGRCTMRPVPFRSMVARRPRGGHNARHAPLALPHLFDPAAMIATAARASQPFLDHRFGLALLAWPCGCCRPSRQQATREQCC